MINKKAYLFLINLFLVFSCVRNSNFDVPESNCSDSLVANTTFAEVKNLYVNGVRQIHQDLIIEGYVISSDKAGNFFGSLHIQEKAVGETEGIQIEIDSRDSHLFYPEGSKIYIKLKGLYLGKSKGIFKLGGVFSAFGNLVVGRLPNLKVPEHIIKACNNSVHLTPKIVAIDSLDDWMINTLVEIPDVEIVEEELGLPFAVLKEETKRNLQGCLEYNLVLLNSGFSDFQTEILPSGRGSITGVLVKNNNDFQLRIRDLEDIYFKQERCPEIIGEFTSTVIFISELADPNNNAGARFVELYNAATAPLSLKGWKLNRYTNANTEVSSSIDLSDFSIDAEQTLVISPNASEFELVYGFAPDVSVGTNSPADSNGDDTLELVDPFGTVIDVFGVIGEDGSGTNHEFEDGRAVRESNILKANPNYAFSEWIIYNDTGSSGTINLPQNAPTDFNPKNR